jgi:dihydroxyacetone kinase DhaKLM complex PTS-EIIA-like component DhaM
MKQQYMGISGKVSHSPQLTNAYNNLLEQLGTEGMLILIERWMDDNDIESILQYNENN